MPRLPIKARILLLVLPLSMLLAVARPPLLFPVYESLENSKNKTATNVPQKQKEKRIPTTWGGSTLSQENKKIDGVDFAVYTLSGGAWIQHKKVKLSSNQIEIIGEDAMLGHLKGGVKVEDKENRITFTAEKGDYDKLTEIVTLTGRPTLHYYNSQNKLTKITSPYMKRYLQENKTMLEGGVIMQDDEYTILTDKAVFLEKEDNLIMEDYPLIFGKELFLTGEKAIYNNQDKLTTLETDTLMVKLSYEAPKKKKEDKEDKVEETKPTTPQPQPEEEVKKVRKLSYFTGDEIRSFSGKDANESYVGMFGNARVIRDDAEFKGNYLKANGKDYKNLESKEYVEFLDKENNTRITGKLFEHSEESGYTHVSEDPVVDFLDKNGKVTSTMKTIELERFAAKKEIVARGNIVIESEDSIVRGEYATYYEEQKKMIVEGNPTLERDGSVVNSGKIILFPEENRAVLSDGLGIKKEKEK
jgi:lipopolysaccharide export system protein LptA